MNAAGEVVAACSGTKETVAAQIFEVIDRVLVSRASGS
jgi:hypothetical protein